MYTVRGEVRRFDGPGGWFYVDVPAEIAGDFEQHFGFVPVRAKIGNLAWETSLMPKRDGSKFLALKAAIRKAHHIVEGDEITVELSRR